METTSPDEDWHGWGVSDQSVPSLHIGSLPGRRSVCLYATSPGTLEPLAYFRSEAAAKQALAILDRLMEAQRG